jgi:hypothetical protein
MSRPVRFGLPPASLWMAAAVILAVPLLGLPRALLIPVWLLGSAAVAWHWTVRDYRRAGVPLPWERRG